MAHSQGWEREFLSKGFSLATVAFLRDISEVVQPGVISLDVTELEALQHEFRLLRNELDVFRGGIQDSMIPTIDRPLFDVNNDFLVKTLTADYTTKNREILICNAAITVTLNTTPVPNERVYIKRTSGAVQIVGTIDGSSNVTLDEDKASVTLVHDAGWWVI